MVRDDRVTAQYGVGHRAFLAQHGVGRGHAPFQLRVRRRERHNLILDYDFHVLFFKWG